MILVLPLSGNGGVHQTRSGPKLLGWFFLIPKHHCIDFNMIRQIACVFLAVNFQITCVSAASWQDTEASATQQNAESTTDSAKQVEAPDLTYKPAEGEAEQDPAASRLSLQLPAADAPRSKLRGVVGRYQADRRILERYWATKQSASRQERFRQFYRNWLEAVSALETDSFCELTRADYHRLLQDIYTQMAENESAALGSIETTSLLPFRSIIVDLAEARAKVEPVDAVEMARQVTEVAQMVKQLVDALNASSKAEASESTPSSTWTVAKVKRAAEDADALRATLLAWFSFYDGYDPQFTWWVTQPFGEANTNLERYVKALQALTESSESEEDNSEWRTFNLALPSFEAPEGRLSLFSSRELLVDDVPDLKAMMSMNPSRMESIIQQYQQQGQRGGRQPRGRRGMDQSRQRLWQWSAALDNIDFDSLDTAERVDYVLLRNQIQYGLARLELGSTSGELVDDQSGIRGRAIGREALLVELAHEMIPYAPEELIEIANRELAWCRKELVKASGELGFGDDWRAAVEHVKSIHLDPGEQPYLVRQLSDEAVDYLRQHDLLTVPPLANETWRMRMMPAEQQLVTPFFTGGEVVTVAFPVSSMPQDAKLQSLRGNNVHFARATVHHELIPGHGLQSFMSARYRTYRGGLGTPFWTEGWALYWEMILYEREFAQTPEDRIGFLVWRSHRCARIIFSLSFHLGMMTPQQCVDFLVENVGFERFGAEGEVRRSFGGMYPPLYQTAYMLGGLQFRNLHEALVKSGKMTSREFHDRIMQEGRIPVEMIRAILLDEKPDRNFKSNWRFYDLE